MKPILFNTDMVKAILDGRKTVTRRLMKPQPFISCEGLENECRHERGFFDTGGNDWACCRSGCGVMMNGKSIYHAPYQVGDILYVRETWCKNGDTYLYKAGCLHLQGNMWIKWHPSIHMPKEASRIFLRVTDVRVEKLSNMTVKDMIAEGVSTDGIITTFGIIEYRVINRWEELWDSTFKKSELNKYGRDANPWVWVIEFERISKEEAYAEGN